jgi:hypothetical protein
VDIAEGFHLEEPPVLLRWGATEQELRQLLPELRQVSAGYLTAPCLSMGGLAHQVGLHMRPSTGGRLAEIELFGIDHGDYGPAELLRSFDEFESHLEATFGPSTETRPGGLGTTSHLWRASGVLIAHVLIYRFGHEEYVRLRAPGQPPFGGLPNDHIVWPGSNTAVRIVQMTRCWARRVAREIRR